MEEDMLIQDNTNCILLQKNEKFPVGKAVNILISETSLP